MVAVIARDSYASSWSTVEELTSGHRPPAGRLWYLGAVEFSNFTLGVVRLVPQPPAEDPPPLQCIYIDVHLEPLYDCCVILQLRDSGGISLAYTEFQAHRSSSARLYGCRVVFGAIDTSCDAAAAADRTRISSPEGGWRGCYSL